MLPDNRTACCLHLATLRENAAAGMKHVMEIAEHMKTDTDALPDDLKPIAQALTDFTIKTLAESLAENLKLISELGLQEITRPANPPTHQTEKEQ